MNLDDITIGRNPTLTYAIVKLIDARAKREAKRRAFWAGLKTTLTFWRK